MDEKNAIIESVSLSIADHGMLSGWLKLNYGGAGQGFGGYCLFSPSKPKSIDHAYAGRFIWRCCQIGGVTEWEKLPGRVIRVRGGSSGIVAIGHAINNDWYAPGEDFKPAGD